jgi:hypothetical protein
MKLADILACALRIYGRHPQQFLLIAMMAIPLGIASTWLNSAVSESWFLVGMVVPLASAVLYVLPAGALIWAVADAWEGRPPSFRRSYAAALSRLISLVMATFLFEVTILVLGLTIIGSPVAIYLLTRWAFYPQAIMLENEGAREALKRSGDIVTGWWLRVTGILVAILIVAVWPMALAMIALSSAPIIVLAVVVSILGAATSPLLAAAITLLFFDQRERQSAQPTESCQSPA